MTWVAPLPSLDNPPDPPPDYSAFVWAALILAVAIVVAAYLLRKR